MSKSVKVLNHLITILVHKRVGEYLHHVAGKQVCLHSGSSTYYEKNSTSVIRFTELR